MKLPRKLKKKFYKIRLHRYKLYLQQDFNWIFKRRMVIVYNYVLANIPIKLSNNDLIFIKNGLLSSPKFKKDV